MKTFKEIKIEALAQLDGKWIEYILIGIFGIIVYQFSIIAGILLLIIPGLIIASISTYAYSNLSLVIVDHQTPEVSDLFQFKDKIWSIFSAFLLMILIGFALAVPSIVFSIIAPGQITTIMIIVITYLVSIGASIRLSYTVFLLRDFNLNGIDALEMSYTITKGQFLRILLFQLSFFGWFLLLIPTFGLLGFWLIPYMNIANANLYREILKESNIQKKL